MKTVLIVSDMSLTFQDAIRRNTKAIVAAWCKATGQTPETFSRKFYNQPSFMREFLAGERSISIDRFGRMLGDARKSWPEDAPFPATDPIPMDGLGKRG